MLFCATVVLVMQGVSLGRAESEIGSASDSDGKPVRQAEDAPREQRKSFWTPAKKPLTTSGLDARLPITLLRRQSFRSNLALARP